MSEQKKSAALVVMATGMGSRYGGLKQLDPIGPNGEIILDFSVYDAARAGFDQAVFIIRRDFEEDFRRMAGERIEKMIDTKYVFQDMTNLPDGFSVPEGRTKPWGTGHAVYCAKDVVSSPFVLINADDYYGRSSFQLIYDHLTKEDELCMAGFQLGNTLTENGTVSRGVCETENGYLKSITEHTALDRNSGIPLDTIVSMNMWGLKPEIFSYLEQDLVEFLENLDNPQKGEFYIPTVVDHLIHRHNYPVRVLECAEKWYGVTYHEDKPGVARALRALVEQGYYDQF